MRATKDNQAKGETMAYEDTRSEIRTALQRHGPEKVLLMLVATLDEEGYGRHLGHHINMARCKYAPGAGYCDPAAVEDRDRFRWDYGYADNVLGKGR
jgi:hypothetical protein